MPIRRLFYADSRWADSCSPIPFRSIPDRPIPDSLIFSNSIPERPILNIPIPERPISNVPIPGRPMLDPDRARNSPSLHWKPDVHRSYLVLRARKCSRMQFSEFR